MTNFKLPSKLPTGDINHQPKRVHTVDELMEEFQVSRRTLQRWRDQGKLSFIKVGRKIFFRADDIEAFLDRYKLEAFAETNFFHVKKLNK